MLRSVGVSSVIERIAPPVALSVWVLSAASVDSRIVLLGQRLLSAGPDSVFWRLLARADVLLRVRIATRRFLRDRLVRTRSILPTRLFEIGVIPVTSLIWTRCVVLNRLFLADIVAPDRLIRTMSGLFCVLIAIRIGLPDWLFRTCAILLLLTMPMPVLRYVFVGTVLSPVARRRTMSSSRGCPSSTGAVCTTSLSGVLRCIGVQFVGTLQLTVVLEPFCPHSFFALRGPRIQLLCLSRLTISLGSSSVGLSLCALCICPLLLDFSLSCTNIMFGVSSFLPNLSGFLPLVFALLRCRLTADCDDDPGDDQDHDDCDDDPDDG
ncbi:hypothetical protein D3I60_04710 [Brevibacterium permense]|uniref:hypothetical protein n=1 Tax=Brevibacterium permense TaxID=234834 RepID=UPI0021D2B189|nr:hypothetical protein [Brevibacterium permense]MCU4296386.1 hypothetical protein [Brevibacterium permense]